MSEIEILVKEIKVLKHNQKMLIKYLNDSRVSIHPKTHKIHLGKGVVIEN